MIWNALASLGHRIIASTKPDHEPLLVPLPSGA